MSGRALVSAPVNRGSFADSLPTDLKEMATWLNKRIPTDQRPRCYACSISMEQRGNIGEVRKIVVYASKSHKLAWACKNYRRCHSPIKLADEQRLFSYVKKRLSHQPRDCRTAALV